MTLSELRILYQEFDENKDAIKKTIESIEGGFVTLTEIERGEYFSYGSLFYSSEDYVIDYFNNLVERDDSFYCDGMEEYFHVDEMVTVYEYRSERYYSRRWVEGTCDLSYYNGNFYDSDALDYHDLVYVEDTGDIDSRDNAYYHESDGSYRSYEPDENEEYVRGYHNGGYSTLNFDNKSKYKIGYEIEKEDEEILQSINIKDFEAATNYQWRKERDGSLSDDCGYELISPTFEFNIDKIFEHIESNNVLLDHINAEKSTRCGGHIHLSEKGIDGEQLFEKIKGYTPLFYALYYGRVDKSYCKGKNNQDLKYENEKYQAIKIHHDRVEFRIISAVPNVETLKWRTKLLMMILQNPTNDVIRAYYNVDTKFTKLLKQTYSNDKLTELKERFIKFTKQFEGLDINK